MQPTAGILHHFQAFSWLRVFPAPKENLVPSLSNTNSSGWGLKRLSAIHQNQNGTAIAVPLNLNLIENLLRWCQTRRRRARKITAINIMPTITNPGAPNSSPMPVFGRAVEVATVVSWAIAAWVNAAATVEVAGSGVSVPPGISVEVLPRPARAYS